MRTERRTPFPGLVIEKVGESTDRVVLMNFTSVSILTPDAEGKSELFDIFFLEKEYVIRAFWLVGNANSNQYWSADYLSTLHHFDANVILC